MDCLNAQAGWPAEPAGDRRRRSARSPPWSPPAAGGRRSGRRPDDEMGIQPQVVASRSATLDRREQEPDGLLALAADGLVDGRQWWVDVGRHVDVVEAD